jgi:AAA15 family ATPase/GTPase
MKITKLELKNFKRFDNLTIDMTALAEAPKLVLLIGTNGSGKSSVFDAFELINKRLRNSYIASNYYQKYVDLQFEVCFSDSNNANYVFQTVNSYLLKDNAFYGRTSVRQIPKLTRTSLGQSNVSFVEDSDRSNTFIDRDNRFENDIEKVASSILSDVFNANISTGEIKDQYINPVNNSFKNIFGTDENTRIKLVSIKPPLEGKTAEILFEKGTSTIPYDYLSSGEKEIFNILLNLLTRKEYFQDSIYFLDEIDLHLNTQLQKSLLKEITENWIPDNCQLWTASHSLGFIEYANETENAAIIDLDSLDFDLPQVITPSPKNRFDVFEIAVSKEFLTAIFKGKKLVFPEGNDTALYNNLNVEDVLFLVAKSKADVFYKAKNNPDYYGLIDRDYLTNEERQDILNSYSNLFILEYYSIENYLYHPDNLEEYYKSVGVNFNKGNYITAIELHKPLVRDSISLGLIRARESYPFFRDDKPKINRSPEIEILKMFDSEDFNTFYKVFPAKDYGREITERQNLNKVDLGKTQWFKNEISLILNK